MITLKAIIWFYLPLNLKSEESGILFFSILIMDVSDDFFARMVLMTWEISNFICYPIVFGGGVSIQIDGAIRNVSDGRCAAMVRDKTVRMFGESDGSMIRNAGTDECFIRNKRGLTKIV